MDPITLSAVVFLLPAVNCVATAGLTVVENGRTNYRIVLPEGSSPSEQFAASELQNHLHRISGVTIPIGREKNTASILLGSRAAPAGVDLSGLGDEGFVIKTVGSDLVIAGGQLRGTMYGVYAFLEDVLGCRWYSSQVSKIPQKKTVTIPSLDMREKPALGFRDVYYTDAWNADFAARNRLNGHHMNLDAKRGGKLYYGPFVHTFRELVPISKYGQSHPEYYSLVKGQRHPKDYDTQLCLTNPDVLRVSTETVLRWIKEDPECKLVSVSPNDLDNHCECAACEAAARELGGQSGLLLKFVNAIADEVVRKHPDVMIDTLAYWYTEWPPKNIRAARNVIVRYCPIWACQMHAYADGNCPENHPYVKNFNGWLKAADNVFVWHYCTNFVHYLAPFPNFYELSVDAKMYRDAGVKGVFWQGNGEPGGNGELAELRAWVISKIAWNPDIDVHATAHDFIDGYYGKAAPHIRSYYDMLHKEVKDKNLHITARSPVTAPLYSAELIGEADRLFELAEKAAETPEVLKRVRRDRMAVEYIQLMQPMEKKEFAGREKELLARADALHAKIKEFGITRIGGWTDIDSMFKDVRKKLTTQQAKAATSRPATNETGSHCHDSSLHLFVDDYHIRSRFAMKRVCGRLEKHPTPVVTDLPGRVASWACVLREPDGKFRAWYNSVCNVSAHEMATAGVWGRGSEFGFFPERMKGAIPETQTCTINYAESDDGFHWVKPKLGLVEWQGSKDNNIVMDGSRAAEQYNRTLTNMDQPSVIKDDADPDPAKRYKMISHWETVHIYDNSVSNLGRSDEYILACRAARGKYLTTSPDGIHWDAPFTWVKGVVGGDYCGVTRDERNKRYWFNDRARKALPGIGYRTAGLCVSEDLYHWPTTVEMVFVLGEDEDYGMRYEHHGMVPFNYGDQDLCYLEVSDGGVAGGYPKMALVGSHHDGERWSILSKTEPLLAVGPRGAHDDGIVQATRNAPIRVGDKLLIFYDGCHYTVDPDKPQWLSVKDIQGTLNVGTIRLDGFAGMAVDAEASARHKKPGMLITRPVTVQNSRLEINIQGHKGSVRVAILDEKLDTIPGYELENCLPIAEDAVRAAVRWKDRADISALQGRRICLLVQMASGTLYSFRM